jgi:hypothetical protein
MLIQIIIIILVAIAVLYSGIISKQVRLAKAVWWLATIVYATVCLYIIPVIGFPFGIMGYFLIIQTGLPAPIGIVLQSLEATIVWFLAGLIGSILSIYALWSIKKNPKWSFVFIGLSIFALLLSIANATFIGTCKIEGFDSSGAVCGYGLVPALPSLFASLTLLASAIVIYRLSFRQTKSQVNIATSRAS